MLLAQVGFGQWRVPAGDTKREGERGQVFLPLAPSLGLALPSTKGHSPLKEAYST